MISPQNADDKLSASERLRRLVLLWGACCLSPIMYLAVAALIKNNFMPSGGWLPVEPYTWSRLMIGLVVYLLLLQALHVGAKILARKKLAATTDNVSGFYSLLTRRTFLLIGISEAAVFVGFCLFMLQGNYLPIFGAGVAAMLLYGQSHPRFALPPDSPL